MDRAFRILTIYNRLLQHKTVNKKSLTLELGSSSRTIQRDIDDIRNFLYETKSWVNIQDEIKYDYKSESYTLKPFKSESIDFMYEILTGLYLTTSTLSHYFYQYLKSLIIRHHSDNQTDLLNFLNNFKIDESKSIATPISMAVQALNERKYLQNNQNLLLPLSMYYQMFSFHLVYELNNEVHITDINKMNLSMTNKSINSKQESDIQDYITFEIAKETWLEIHRYYNIHVIENYDDKHLIVTFKMTKPEAIQLCFLYRSNIRIISPPDLKKQVIDELLLLQSTYLKQRIQI